MMDVKQETTYATAKLLRALQEWCVENIMSGNCASSKCGSCLIRKTEAMVRTKSGSAGTHDQEATGGEKQT